MKLSIVATLFQSSKHLGEFYKRVIASATDLAGDDFEIVLVNDGSPDDSLEKAISLSELDEKVVVIDLSRNYGHHKAMMTGLSESRGDKVFLIDSDLEESPEWLIGFATELDQQTCDVVYGVQSTRKGSKFEQITGNLFYKLFDLLTEINLPKNIVTARLMTRRYVNALVLHRDTEVFLAGLWHITGFKQVGLTVNKLNTSESTYTIQKRISVLVNSVTSFSNAPLKAIFYFGISISLLALLYISYLIFHIAFISTPLSGWTSIMASIWLLGGMIISFLGIIGIYLAKIFSETKDRPYTVIRQRYGRKS